MSNNWQLVRASETGDNQLFWEAPRHVRSQLNQENTFTTMLHHQTKLLFIFSTYSERWRGLLFGDVTSFWGNACVPTHCNHVVGWVEWVKRGAHHHDGFAVLRFDRPFLNDDGGGLIRGDAWSHLWTYYYVPTSRDQRPHHDACVYVRRITVLCFSSRRTTKSLNDGQTTGNNETINLL